ncbi:darcynin family protein [Paraburkholderia sp.]|uniref:darcynin family protein n=1 Tax=Paraburkholderia sp. TaxID=1926495 RepID=UPI00239C37BE|nr:darcynin family protein [Paraburkholderia sp.]MDE1182519.1 hypothetical protein [Paraburkholderia sp.]
MSNTHASIDHPSTRANVANPPIYNDDTTVMTVFMLVKTREAWLQMHSGERAQQLHTHLAPLLRQYAGRVRLRFFDTEFYSARVTDVWMWDIQDRGAYEEVVEALRDTPFWDRLFDIVEILPGAENADAKRYLGEAMIG